MTVHSVAGGDALRYDAVFDLPWVYVWMNRRIRLQEFIFNKRLNDIKIKKR